MRNEHLVQILLEQGMLDHQQFGRIQQKLNGRPVWQTICDEAGVEENRIWQACADYLRHQCERVNLVRERIDPQCLGLLRPREAWEYLILPMRMEGGQLVCATTEETLAAALGFLEHGNFPPFRLVISEIRLLEDFIAERYAYEGVELHD